MMTDEERRQVEAVLAEIESQRWSWEITAEQFRQVEHEVADMRSVLFHDFVQRRRRRGAE